MHIRPAEFADISQIIALDKIVTGLAKPDYWHGMFERYGAQQHKESFFLVAERERYLEGFVAGEIRAWEFGSPPCGWIFAIQIRPKARLKGVGSELFNAICSRFRESGVVNIRTMIARDNTPVLSFFRSQGMAAGPFIELETALENGRKP